ncbi:hypothetical protein [Fibrella aquatilis]|uniref:Uncharacterized protein n=1 Tax=Fibrella aquatilis TaxID=2817059 RepID=A0A939GCF8_9BACT|nr:hypothetical protein [Fibrella aquatilis]MBO0934037.1 hypothetical protein [Fibrella aquatilis]
MQRRVFITKTLSAFLLPLVPGAVLGAATSVTSPTASAQAAQLQQLVAQLGALEQLQCYYSYSPGYTSLADLANLIRHDFARLAAAASTTAAGQALQANLATDALFANASADPFGSFGHSFQLGGVAVHCQVLARINMPDAPPRRRNQLLGTLGVVACTNDTITHLNLAGEVLHQSAFTTHQSA